jgi:hypothetical protein
LAKRISIPRGWFYGETEKGRRFQELFERMKANQKIGKGPAKGVRNSKTNDIEAVDGDSDNQNDEG